VHSCVRSRISVHFPKRWRLAVHSSVRGKMSVHLLEGWWFRCIHVWGVWYRCIYKGRDDFSAFMCESKDSGAFTWGTMISVYSCVRGKIPVHLFEGWRCRCIHFWEVGYCCIYQRSDDLRCIHVWGERFRSIYLRDDDFGAFMCQGKDIGAFTWGVTICGVFKCLG